MYDWTSSASKPPEIAVHVLAETPGPASRQLVRGVSIVNKSANMPLILNEVLYLLLPKQGNKKLSVLSLSLCRGAALGSGIHKSNYHFKAIQLWKRLSCLFDWQQLLVHKPIQLILYFLISWQHINFVCLCDQLLVKNSLQCLCVINLEGTNYQQNCQ